MRTQARVEQRAGAVRQIEIALDRREQVLRRVSRPACVVFRGDLQTLRVGTVMRTRTSGLRILMLVAEVPSRGTVTVTVRPPACPCFPGAICVRTVAPGALTSSLHLARWLFCVCRIDCDSYDSDKDVRKEHGEEERLAALLRLKAECRTIRISDTESLALAAESFSAKAAVIDCRSRAENEICRRTRSGLVRERQEIQDRP